MDAIVVGSRIKKLMENKNITIEQLSKKMGINEKELEKKLKGEEEFFIGEMAKIKVIFELNLKEFDELFFKDQNYSKI